MILGVEGLRCYNCKDNSEPNYPSELINWKPRVQEHRFGYSTAPVCRATLFWGLYRA